MLEAEFRFILWHFACAITKFEAIEIQLSREIKDNPGIANKRLLFGSFFIIFLPHCKWKFLVRIMVMLFNINRLQQISVLFNFIFIIFWCPTPFICFSDKCPNNNIFLIRQLEKNAEKAYFGLWSFINRQSPIFSLVTIKLF